MRRVVEGRGREGERGAGEGDGVGDVVEHRLERTPEAGEGVEGVEVEEGILGRGGGGGRGVERGQGVGGVGESGRGLRVGLVRDGRTEGEWWHPEWRGEPRGCDGIEQAMPEARETHLKASP